MATASSALETFQSANLIYLIITPSYPTFTILSTNWSVNTQQTPSDLSAILKIFSASLTTPHLIHFTFCSGGHVVRENTLSIQDSVPINPTNFSQIIYDEKVKLARLGSAARWGVVFQELAKVGVAVCGGRDSDVGIGGFLPGGENSSYTGSMGISCNIILSMTVILFDGAIVTASQSDNPELFRALKGGSGNFGIVTKFVMETRLYFKLVEASCS